MCAEIPSQFPAFANPLLVPTVLELTATEHPAPTKRVRVQDKVWRLGHPRLARKLASNATDSLSWGAEEAELLGGRKQGDGRVPGLLRLVRILDSMSCSFAFLERRCPVQPLHARIHAAGDGPHEGLRRVGSPAPAERHHEQSVSEEPRRVPG